MRERVYPAGVSPRLAVASFTLITVISATLLTRLEFAPDPLIVLCFPILVAPLFYARWVCWTMSAALAAASLCVVYALEGYVPSPVLEGYVPSSARTTGLFVLMLVIEAEIVSRVVAIRKQREQSLQESEKKLRELNVTLENRVAGRTAELRVTNAELDAFAYSVSHDLRAPLRAMHGFAEALLEDYADRLDAEGRGFAEKIVSAADRMEGLIHDLLTYSRIGRTEIDLTSVDLTDVVDECLIELEAEIRQGDAQFTVARPLPMARGHRTTLIQIVRNLVSNAVKFVAEGERPQVRIWAESQNGRIVLSIKDNGIGILPAYHERIFQIFERLHGNETYPGTGIGLAIVRRAAESLGGRVGLESSPGEGSRIWVELPSAE